MNTVGSSVGFKKILSGSASEKQDFAHLFLAGRFYTSYLRKRANATNNSKMSWRFVTAMKRPKDMILPRKIFFNPSFSKIFHPFVRKTRCQIGIQCLEFNREFQPNIRNLGSSTDETLASKNSAINTC